MEGSTNPTGHPTDDARNAATARASREAVRKRRSGRPIVSCIVSRMARAAVAVGPAVRGAAAAVAVALACGVPASAGAQRGGDSVSAAANAAHAIGVIKGRIVLPQAPRRVIGGSVSVRRLRDSAFMNGAFVDSTGAFVVAGLPADRYAVRIRVLGYAPVVRSDVRISPDSARVDLGDIPLVRTAVRLEAQTITADQPDVVLAPDRSSYSVKKLTTTAGGTAIDVLRHLPGVAVDATAQVSLNGSSNVVVQVNGRPTPLHGEELSRFVAQIPAHAIARVEVATNPSAKEDPDGTAGIINIVLDRDTGLGLNGALSATVGSAGGTASGNVGTRVGRLTLFASADVARNRRSYVGTSTLSDLLTTAPDLTRAATKTLTRPTNTGLTVRSEYALSERYAVAADAYITGGHVVSSSTGRYTTFGAANDPTQQSTVLTAPSSRNTFEDYALSLRRTAGTGGAEVSTMLRYTGYRQHDSNDVSTALADVTPQPPSGPLARERDTGASRIPMWTWQADYTRRVTPRLKVDAGVKATDQSTHNSLVVDRDTDVAASASGLLAFGTHPSILGYRERIGAGYAVVSSSLSHVESQFGLRVEEATTQLDLPLSGEAHRYTYGSVFPSGTLIYHATPTEQFKLSYSRRISRPDPVELDPAAYLDRPRSIFQGNPSLRPEYTDAIGSSVQNAFGWGTLQVSPFIRRTAHAVRYIRTVDSSGTTHATFANISSSLYVGSNLNVSVHRGPLALSGGGSAFRLTSDASEIPGHFSVNTFAWSLRGDARWQFDALTTGEISAHYLAPMGIEGGRQASYTLLDVAFEHQLWHKQGSVVLRFADPLALTSLGLRTETDAMLLVTHQTLGTRAVSVSISRSFGRQLKLHAPPTDATQPMSRPVEP